MELVGSIIKYKGSKSIIDWLKRVPLKLSMDNIEVLLDKAIEEKPRFLIYTKEEGIKVIL